METLKRKLHTDDESKDEPLSFEFFFRDKDYCNQEFSWGSLLRKMET